LDHSTLPKKKQEKKRKAAEVWIGKAYEKSVVGFKKRPKFRDALNHVDLNVPVVKQCCGILLVVEENEA